jgi:hypothetical protein
MDSRPGAARYVLDEPSFETGILSCRKTSGAFAGRTLALGTKGGVSDRPIDCRCDKQVPRPHNAMMRA